MMNDAAPVEAAIPLTRLQRFSLRTYFWIESLSHRILWLLEHRSKSCRLFIGCIIGLLCMFSLRHVAHADAPAGATHLLQNEIDTAYDVAFQFDLLGNAITLAQIIFSTLAATTIIVNIVSYYIRNQSVKGLGQVVLSSILRLGIPFVIIGLAPTVLPSISLTGLQIAADVAGNGSFLPYGNAQYVDAPPPSAISLVLSDLYNNTFGTINNNQSNVTITPSNIATFGENIGFTLIDKAECAVDQGKWDASQATPCTGQKPAPAYDTAAYNSDQQIMQTIIVLAIGIIGIFVFIAVELVIAYLQIYLVLPVAAFSLGFLGSPATRQYGAGYWTVVVSALLKFVTIVFTIGFAITVANTWASALGSYNFNSLSDTSTVTNTDALKVAIGYSMASFSLLYIVRIIPSLFAGLLTGNAGSADGSQAEYQAQGIGARFQGGTGGKSPTFSNQLPARQTIGPQP